MASNDTYLRSDVDKGETNPDKDLRLRSDADKVSAPSYYQGFRVQGEGDLALVDVGTHPLRVRKGGTTYGLELVDITDGNASRIRIQTPSGIKALRKYT